MKKLMFDQDDHVIIHSLGDDNEYEGTVNGVATDYPNEDAGPNTYIVKIESSHGMFKDYRFSHFAITGACLRLKN